MSRQSRHQSARYDEDGNIILPENDTSEAPPEDMTEEKQKEEPATGDIPEKSVTTPHLKNAIVREGITQYSQSFKSILKFAGSCKTLAKKILAGIWRFAAQPVWIMVPDKSPKQYRRGTLFILDSIRFGGTFSTIFLLLFISLNYDSFWQIAKERVNPIQHAQRMQSQLSTVDAALKEKLLKSPTLATAGRKDGNILEYLPDVGPPDNRILIPKLGLNVPLVTPPFESLLQENWEQVETDIQHSLQNGVVHYPGTARPGQTGNFFVTGHSSYYPWAPGDFKTIFARLHYLEPGDEYYVYYNGDQYKYVVQTKDEVKPSNVHVLEQPTDRRISTLMTCTPVGTTLRRLVLISQEVDPETNKPINVGVRKAKALEHVKPEMLPI